MKDKTTDRSYELWLLITQTRRAMLRARRRELAKYNMSGGQGAILSAVEALGERATVTAIARWLFREVQSVSEILCRMENKGLLRRVKDLERRNLLRVVLTDKGREAQRKALNRESIHRIMSCLSDEEREQLWTFMLRLRSSAQEEVGDERKITFPSDV